jgi:hypothetical protein
MELPFGLHSGLINVLYPTNQKSMKSRFSTHSTALACALASLSATAAAQDFFRELGTSRSSGGIGPVFPASYSVADGSFSGMRRVTPVDEAEAESKYNFAIGPVRMSIAAGVGLEWNDNITLSEDNRESDFIFRPLISVDLMWPVTPEFTLELTVGASWAKYLDHSEYDSGGLILSPNSALTLGFTVGPLEITIRDRFSYQEDPYEILPLSNVARYQRYENQIGVEVSWAVNEKLTLALGYDHYNLWSTNDTFDSEDRSIDTLLFRPTYQLTPAVKTGLFASYSLVRFDSASRSDADVIMVGPFVDVQLTDYITLYLEAGYQSVKYDGTSTFDDDYFTRVNKDFFDELTSDERALFADSDDADGLYVKFQLTHTPSEVFRHQLSFTKTAEIGFGSNYYDLYHLEYGATYTGIRATEISPSVFYEWYETSGSFSEEAHRIGVEIALRHQITNSLVVGLDYRFLLKDSNVAGADYYQNLVLLSLFYRF